jgi:UPF0755 protein
MNDGAMHEPKNPRRPRSVFLISLLIALCCAGAAAYEAHRFLNTPPDQPGITINYTVEPGSTFNRVAHDLESMGVITSASRFRVLVRLHDAGPRLRAGVFHLSTGWTPEEVLHILTTRGAMPIFTSTIREGLPWWQVARQLEAEGHVTFEQFEQVIHDREFLAAHGIPFDNAEGFLFPDTYYFARPYTEPTLERRRALVSRLISTFWDKTRVLWPEGPPDEKTLRHVLILASVVEKETGRADERARVAGVFTNRLRLGMLLQADPTIVYGIGPSFTGRLRRSQLNDATNPYNTYQHRGLPPGPICSPGILAMAAVIDPEEHDYLYFVSRNDGSHQFSRTLNEHINAVNRYQRRR